MSTTKSRPLGFVCRETLHPHGEEHRALARCVSNHAAKALLGSFGGILALILLSARWLRSANFSRLASSCEKSPSTLHWRRSGKIIPVSPL
jgi:hypothetical protein